ncbi:hypothetical protein ACFODL_00380 [Phenylobacterium terrae]|uniref:Uncharacterized protein n=1 Tax=Phenylobacterium terrae TaxID=2665495 RepID=A0ABW4MXE6_9CAUL
MPGLRHLPTPVFWIATLALGLVMGMALSSLRGAPPLLGALLGLLILLAGGSLAVLLWRRLDEVAREAHKWAWYWGAPIALLLAALTLFLEIVPSERLLAAESRQELFFLGFGYCAAAQMGGYLIAWIGWWISRSFDFGTGR